MKIGDLVKRKCQLAGWIKFDPWMAAIKETGLVVEYIDDTTNPMVVVQWPDGGLCWEYTEELELL